MFDFQKLLKALQEAEAAAPGIMSIVEDLLSAFNGTATLKSSTIKCGPDGCTDPLMCIEAAITSEIQTLAALAQAKKSLIPVPAPAPAPVDPVG
jgi:hypothetical protein